MAQKEVTGMGTNPAPKTDPSETLTQQVFPDTPNAPPIRGQVPLERGTCLCDDCVIFDAFGVERSLRRAAQRRAEDRGDYARYVIADGVSIQPELLHMAAERMKERRRDGRA